MRRGLGLRRGWFCRPTPCSSYIQYVQMSSQLCGHWTDRASIKRPEQTATGRMHVLNTCREAINNRYYMYVFTDHIMDSELFTPCFESVSCTVKRLYFQCTMERKRGLRCCNWYVNQCTRLAWIL